MNNYANLLELFQNEHAPFSFVDLDAFDANIENIKKQFQGTTKTVRVATKSIRVPALIKRVLDAGKPFQGLMNYSAEEILFLSEQGFDDFWLAYPSFSKSSLRALRNVHDQGKNVKMVVDQVQSLCILAAAMKGVKKPFQVVIDIDLSIQLAGSHLGVWRSPVRDQKKILELLSEIKKYPELKCVGLQAYEAHIAGLTDQNPFKKIGSALFYFFRRWAAKKAKHFRKEISKMFQAESLLHFNGGGTGSIDFCLKEDALTEITVGSAFLCPHLFDYYSNQKFKPACFFALEISRIPDSKIRTCLGGGYIASGDSGDDKLPLPHLPLNGKLFPAEGAGEVQTPVYFTSLQDKLDIGDLIFFRHAKAGELFERYKQVILIQKNSILRKEKTYRGFGQCFF